MRKVAAVFSVLLVLSLGLAGSFVVVTGTVQADHTTNPPTDVVVVNESGGLGVTNTTIQAGVNHANPGDTVFVESGTYEESVVVNTTDIVIATNESVTLDGSTVTGPAFNVTSAEGNVSNVELGGFTIANYETGVSVDGVEGPPDDATLDMRNISVLNNTFQDISGTAVSVDHESGEFERVTIGDNTITNATDGVSVSVGGSVSTENVTVGKNSMGGGITGSAVSLSASGSTSLTDVNVVLNNGSESGTGLDVSLQDSASITDLNVTGNDFSAANEDAISLATGSSSTQTAGLSNVEIGTNLLNDSDSGAGVNVTTLGGATVDDITVDGAVGNASTNGVILEARGSSDISGVEITGSLLSGSAESAVSLAGAGGTVQDVTVDSNGLNASGSGLRIDATAGGSVSNVSVTENNASRGSDGLVIVSDGASSTVDDIDVSNTLLNETDGTGLQITATDGEIRNVSLTNVDARNNQAGLDVSAASGATISNISTDTASFGESTNDAGVLQATDATIEEVTFASTGFNESGGTGLALSADDGTVQSVSMDTVTAGNNDVGIDATATGTGTISDISTDVALFGESTGDAGVFEATGTDATIEDLTFESTGFNESGGTGLTLLADDGTVQNISMDTVTAGNNDVGINATAAGAGTISGISTDVALFGESDGNAGVFEAVGADATIEDLAFSTSGFNKSGGTGLALSADDGAIRDVSLDTVTAGNNDAGIDASATGTGTISGISTNTALFGESTGDAGVFEATGTDATIEDLAFELTGFNKSGGTGLTLLADDGTVQNISMDTVIAGNNDVGIDATASGTGTISGISTDVALFGESADDAGVFEATGTDATIEDLAFELTGFNKSGGTGLTLLAEDGTVRNVSLDTVIASDNTVGANATAAGNGLIRNVSANTVLFSGNDDGLRLGAVDDARIEDVQVERSGLNETTNAAVLFDGDGGTYSGVKVFESLIRDNDGAGVLITEDTSTEGLRVQRSLIANNGIGINNQNETGVFDARNNWWGDSSGPSSASGGDTPYADPVNGKLAIGDGDSVSEGATPGVSNVRFDPAIGGKTRNEGDNQLIDPIALAEDQNVQQIPDQFSAEFAGQTIEGPTSDFVGLNLWSRSVLPLRGDDADAANKIRNPEVVFRTEDGDISINRDFIKVYQNGESLNVTFEQTTGADTSQFAGTEVQFHVFRANDTSSLSGAFSQSINQTTGEVSVGSDDVEIVEVRDLGEIDENGSVNVEFTPDRPGEYLFALTTVESGDGFELNDTGTGRLSANVLNDSTVFVGFEAITVQQTSSTVTPDKDRVLPGENVEFDAQANFEGDNIDHAVLLFDKAAYDERLVVINSTSVEASGDETQISESTLDGLPLSGIIPDQLNVTAPADTARINVTGFVDGEPFLVSINVTDEGCDPLNSTIPSSIAGAEDDPCVNDITTAGAIRGVPFDVAVVQSGSSAERLNLVAPTEIAFENGNKTFQWVHAAVSGDNTLKRSTDVGTITVQKPEITVTPENLDFGTRRLNRSKTETVTVTNTGGVPINLTSITIRGQDAGEFAITDIGSTVLASGENTTLNVTFDPTTDGSKTAQLEIATNVSSLPTTNVSLSGTAVSLEIETIVNTSDEFRFLIRNLQENEDVNLSTPGLGDADVAFDSLQFRTADSISTASEIDIRIVQSTARPGIAPELPVAGDVARYLNVTPVGIGDDDIENAQFRFRISESRLGDSGPEDVAFYRFNNGSWDAVNTTFNGTTSNGDSRFVARSPGFSAFAVVINETKAPSINVDPGQIDFGEVDVGSTATESVTVTNDGNATLEISSVELSGADANKFSFVGLPSDTVAPGENTTIEVVFVPDSDGDFSAQLDIESNDSENDVVTVSISGTGEAVPAPSINVDPGQIDFGEVDVGSTATESVTVTNDGNATLNISSVGISGADAGAFTVVSDPSETVTPGESTTVDVEFAPDSEGDFSAQLDIGSNDTEVNVDLSGTGAEAPVQEPAIDVDPDQIDFGDVEVNSTATESVTVTNGGNATLNISSVGISGADAGTFTIVTEGSDTVAPSENTTIEVEFAPDSEGNFSAQIDIESNDSESGVVTVGLSGTGEAPEEFPEPPVAIIVIVTILLVIGVLAAVYFRGTE